MQKHIWFTAVLALAQNWNTYAYAQSAHHAGLGGFFHRVGSWFQGQSSQNNNLDSTDANSAPVNTSPQSPQIEVPQMVVAQATPSASPPSFLNRKLSLNALTDTAAETSDGVLELRGQLPPGAQIKLTVTNSTDHGVEHTQTDRLITADDGSFSINGQLLNQGPGLYIIDVWVAQPGETNFSQVNELKVNDTTNVYTMPSQSVESEAPQIVALANSLTSGMTDDLSKAQEVHDWVATHIVYDYADDHGTPNLEAVIDAVGVMNSGKTICQGYANLYAAIARAAGLTVRVVSSTQIDHAWNEVLIDGQWTSVDTTWDASPEGTLASERYFNFPTFGTAHPVRSFADND